jgi:hypothetical protein
LKIATVRVSETPTIQPPSSLYIHSKEDPWRLWCY